jgi:hypothetical protein
MKIVNYNDSKEMAEKHVDWFLNIIRPIIIEHMVHGYKHGFEDALNKSLNIVKKHTYKNNKE